MKVEGDVRILGTRTSRLPNPGNHDDTDDHYDFKEIYCDDRGSLKWLIAIPLLGFDISHPESLGSATRQLVKG
jgi:hypothetical protein